MGYFLVILSKLNVLFVLSCNVKGFMLEHIANEIKGRVRKHINFGRGLLSIKLSSKVLSMWGIIICTAFQRKGLIA